MHRLGEARPRGYILGVTLSLLALLVSATSAHSAEVVAVLPDGVPVSALRHPGVGFAEGGRDRTRRLTVDPAGEAWLAELGVSVTPIAPPPTPEEAARQSGSI